MRENVAKIMYAGGEWLPGISRFSAAVEDIDGEGSTRNEVGIMHREILRANVKHIDVEHIVRASEMRLICAIIKNDAQLRIRLLCPADPGSDKEGYCCGDFYISGVQTDMITYNGECWWKVSYSAIQI